MAFVWLGRAWDDRRQAKIAAQRLGESISTFACGFNCRRTDTRVIRAVYEGLQPLCAFPLRASDDLDKDLRVVGEEFDLDIVPALARRTNRSLDGAEHNHNFGRIHTVTDLVAFFCAQSFASATVARPGALK